MADGCCRLWSQIKGTIVKEAALWLLAGEYISTTLPGLLLRSGQLQRQPLHLMDDDAMLFRPLLHVGSGETGETQGTPAVLRRRSVDRDGERGQRFQVCWFVCRCVAIEYYFLFLVSLLTYTLSSSVVFFTRKIQVGAGGRSW